MAELIESLGHPKSEPRSNVERSSEGDSTPKTKLCFGIPRSTIYQAPSLGANANLFASPGEGNRGFVPHNKL